MKKLSTFILVIVMFFSLTACNSSSPSEHKTSEIAALTDVSTDGEPMTAEEIEYYLAKGESDH